MFFHASLSRTFYRLSFLLVFATLTLTSCVDTPADTDNGNGGTGDGGNGVGFNYDHRQGSGKSAADFLNREVFQQLVIEIDYVDGQKPTRQALDSLKKMLADRLFKPDGISISVSGEPIGTGGRKSYTISDIRNLEDKHRDIYSSAGKLAAYFLFLDGRFQQENVLGLAYYNTSMAIMEEAIKNNSGGIGEPPRYKIEATVLKHEFAHNLGLVGNGTPTVSDHKTDGSAHCMTNGCLMEPAVETTDYFANIFDGTVPDLKSDCLMDLSQNGGK